MLRIKLSRRGKKKQPFYRILVMEKSKDPWGTFLENVGTYNPRDKENKVTLVEDRIKYWISVGAQPTPTVHNLLVDAGIIKEKKVRGSNLGKKYKDKVKAEAEKAKEEKLAAKEAAASPASAEATAGEPKEEKAENAPADAITDKPAEEKAEEPKAEEVKPDEKPTKEEEKKEESHTEKAKPE